LGNLGVAVRIISNWVLKHVAMVCTVFVLLKQGPEAHPWHYAGRHIPSCLRRQ